MAKRSNKTVWLIVAVLALIAAQVAVLGFVVARFVSPVVVAQQANPGKRKGRTAQQFPTPVARPLQPQPMGRNVVVPKPQPKPKPTGPRAEPPTFSKAGGIFTNSFKVELKAKSAKAVIRYTLDGSDPVESSPAYSQPITMKNTTYLRAACFETGLAPSMSVSHNYTLLGDDLIGFTSNL